MDYYERQGFFKQNAVWIVAIIALILFGLLLWQGWDKIINSGIDSMTTITGNFSCLLLKDAAKSATSCELGVRSRDGRYYALDTSRIQDANTDLKAEDNIAVTGIVKPDWELPGSPWAKYDVVGIIQVNTLLRTR